uniref:NACHT and ankyrin domain protein n=1 Tax=Mycena chlorophos TaxID=658473 RepID=A0ABQ0M6C7_MYCCL|nr:NACHT and ankyrin domain protein [Mycena chlorophos]
MGGPGGTGQGPNVTIHTSSVNFSPAQNDDYHAILDFVSPINFLLRQQEINETRHKNTGTWLLEDPVFLEWKSGSTKLLWCTGIPGAGKTVLASLIIHTLNQQRDSQVGVACAYLNYKESTTQTLKNILGAIWQQLNLGHELQLARELYKKHSRDRTNITLDEILALLEDAAGHSSKVYIVLDALDEYSVEDKDQLIDMIIDIGTNVHLLVTSRPGLSPPEHITSSALKIHPPDQDIETYILTQINGHRRLRKFAQDQNLRNDIVQTITSKADGMFLFVKLQLKLLSSALTKQNVHQALQGLPADVEVLYAQTLEQIKTAEPQLQELALAAISWVAFTKRPLTVMELRAALAIPITQPFMPDENSMILLDDILEACRGLIIVNDTSQEKILRLVHYSAQQYIEKIQDQTFPDVQTGICKTLFTCLHWAEDSKDFESSRWTISIDSTLHPLLNYAQFFLAHMKGNQEHSLGTEFASVIPTLKRYPEWYIEPWCFQYLPKDLTTLWTAVAGNLLQLVSSLLENSVQDYEISKAMIVASRYGYHTMLETLYAAQSSVDIKDLNLALHQATVGGHKQMVKFLLSKGASMNASIGNETALEAAVAQKDQQMVHLLLQAGADPNLSEGSYRTTLPAAVMNKDQQMAQLLLQANADFNLIGDYGTALHTAVMRKDQQMVQLLQQAGADLNLVGGLYGTALQAAAIAQDEQMVQLLLQAGADPNLVGGNYGTALQAAVVKENQQVVQVLLQARADPNLIGGLYGTALQAAVIFENQEIVQLLLQANADLNLIGENEGPPLYTAIVEEDQSMAKLLLQAGADPNVIGKHETILYAAALKKDQEIVHLLLQAGADPNLVGRNCETALHAAAVENAQQIVQLLLQAGADLNLVGGLYGTPLQAASINKNQQLVRMLLQAGADPNVVGGYFKTALKAATIKEDQQIVQLLVQAGADSNVIAEEE